MADYSKLSDAELMAMFQPPPATQPAQSSAPPTDYANLSNDDLLKLVQPAPVAQPSITDAVTDIPAEIGRTASNNLGTIESNLSNRGENTSPFGFLNTGKAVLGGLGLLASPITGAARSLIGHPMAQAEHAIGTVINPAVAAHDDPQKMYEAAAGDVETALSAARPAGVGPLGLAVPKPVSVAAPSVGELKAAARAGYQNPTVAAVDIDPKSVSLLSSKIENDLAKQGFRPRLTPGVFDEVKSLVPPQGVSAVKVADIDAARKALGQYSKMTDITGKPTPDAAAASNAIRHINDYLPNLAAGDVLAGDAPAAAQILKDAVGNWGAAKRADQVDLQLTRADRQAAKSGSGSNIENSMRQRIATLLDNPKRTIGYSDAEKQAMESIVRGTATRNALRKVGKLGFGDGLSLLLHEGAAFNTGGASVPVGIAGTIARKAGEALTARAGRNLSDMVRSRSPLATSNQGQAAVAQALMGNSTAPLSALVPAAEISKQDPRTAAIIRLLLGSGQIQ
jgi:hypothetical protein